MTGKDECDDSIMQQPSGSMTEEDTLSSSQANKIQQIENSCRARDVATLGMLATSAGGLIDDDARRKAWPILMGCREDDQVLDPDWSVLKKHRDEDQVELDVNRSFVYYPENESPERIKARKRELSDLIVGLLRRHPMLCYFQGYHDIIQVFLLVLGARTAEPVIARLSLLRIRDFMLPTLAGAEAHLHLLPAILFVADSQLHAHLSGATRPTPFFALAATLTLYAHDIEEYGDIARLFDYLLASEAVVPVYLFAVIVTSRKKELLEVEPDEPEMLHFILSKLPKPLELERLIQRTQSLFQQHPPDQLPNRVWKRISRHSVLKTARDPNIFARQTLQDGERLLDIQASEIRRQDFAKQLQARAHALAVRYQRPVGWTGAAVLVAVLALYLGKPIVPHDWMTTTFRLQDQIRMGLQSIRAMRWQ